MDSSKVLSLVITCTSLSSSASALGSTIWHRDPGSAFVMAALGAFTSCLLIGFLVQRGDARINAFWWSCTFGPALARSVITRSVGAFGWDIACTVHGILLMVPAMVLVSIASVLLTERSFTM